MVLLDDERRHVEVNGAYLKQLGYERRELIGRPIYELVVGGPLSSHAEWEAALSEGHFTGEAELICADGGTLAVQWAATTEIVTGQRLALFVAMSTSRWGRSFRRSGPTGGGPPADHQPAVLTGRELEIVRLVALGNTGPEIADELLIAHDTVRTHARNAMAKVGARSRAHLVAKALGEGLVID
jgi:PAS domain S-box-containing protein